MSDESIYSHLADSINSAVSRRKFMQLTGIGAGSVLGGSVLAHLQALAAPPVASDEGILVMIYLGGGCDPLNTFTPFTNNTYRNARPDLSLSPSGTGNRGLLQVNDAYGFHPSLTYLHSMYMNGKLAVMPGIGFGGQDLSHFSSVATYMRGWGGTGTAASGWVGRFLDLLPNPEVNSSRGITINGTMPLTLQGSISSPVSLPENINEAYMSKNNDITKHCAPGVGGFTAPDGTISQVAARNLKEAVSVPGQYRPGYPASGKYNDVSGLESNMAITAGVINANLGARVIHVSHGSYDTHTNQIADQALRLGELDAAIQRFFTDLSPQFADRVSLMVYSEFGRRLQQNGNGTDHGRASQVMLMGTRVAGGRVLTDIPDLTATDSSGNLVETTDFRQVYADIATSWLKTDTEKVAGKTYSPLGIFASGPGTSGTTSPTSSSTTTTTKPTTSSTSTTTTTKPTTTTTTTKPTTTTTTTKPTTTTTRPVEDDWWKLVRVLLRRRRRRRR